MAHFQILTVCTGNICRSPLAEYYFRAALDPQEFSIASGGTRAVPDGRVPEQQIEIAQELGITDIGRHVAQQLSPSQIDRADLILTVSLDHRRRVVRTQPSAIRKTFTIREFARIAQEITVGDIDEFQKHGMTSLESGVASANILRGAAAKLSESEYNIIDPYGQPESVYRESASELVPAVRDIADFLALLAQRDHINTMSPLTSTVSPPANTVGPLYAATEPPAVTTTPRTPQIVAPEIANGATFRGKPLSFPPLRSVATTNEPTAPPAETTRQRIEDILHAPENPRVHAPVSESQRGRHRKID